MKKAALLVLALFCELVFAGPGGTGRRKDVSYHNLIPPAGDRLLLVEVLSIGKKGKLIVRAADNDGTLYILKINERQLFQAQDAQIEIQSTTESLWEDLVNGNKSSSKEKIEFIKGGYR